MAIIYTFPDLGAVDGSEKLLVTDGTDENNTKTVTTAAYGAYINATYGGAGGSTIYQADGSIVANRQLSGSSLYSLTFTSLTGFTLDTTTNIALNPTTTVDIGEQKGITTANATGTIQGIKDRNNANNNIHWLSRGLGLPGVDLILSAAQSIALRANNATDGVSIFNGVSGKTTVDNGLVLLTGSNNDIADINQNKHLVTKEWVDDPTAGYVPNWTGSTNITTLGTITTGTWNGTTISPIYGGTGQTGYSTGDIIYADGANSLDRLGIGNAGEVLTVSGGLPSWQSISSSSLTNVTTTYTVLSTDETVNCTSVSGFTVNLTTAVGEIGRKIIIKNSGAGDITVDANAAETIDGALTATLVQYESITIQSDGANWIII